MQPDQQVVQAMQAIPWFRSMELGIFNKLAEISSVVEINAGEMLFHEGDRDEGIYIVVNGRIALEIFVPVRGRVRIETVEPFDLVGWSSATPVVRQRTAGARAVLNSRLICTNAEKLRILCDEDHDLGYLVMNRIANIIAGRLVGTRLQLLDIFAGPETPHAE
jgi:CRP/FNR family transcriptional regulator, cyclic AMP receptor protein